LTFLNRSWLLVRSYTFWNYRPRSNTPLYACVKIWGGRLCHIFLTTFYDIIFQWWSYTHNSDQNVVWTWFVFKGLNLPPPDFNVMEWPCPFPLCWVHDLAHSNGLTFFTQHHRQGLDYAIDSGCSCSQLSMLWCMELGSISW
jgi:hypothetical protein